MDASVKDVKNPAGKTLAKALKFVHKRLAQLGPLAEEEAYSDQFLQWENITSSGLTQYFGRDSEEYRWVFPKPTRPNVITGRSQAEIGQRTRDHYVQRMSDQRIGLNSILEKYTSTPAASRLAFWHPLVTTSQSLFKRLLSSLAALPRLVRWLIGLAVAGAVSGVVALVVQRALG